MLLDLGRLLVRVLVLVAVLALAGLVLRACSDLLDTGGADPGRPDPVNCRQYLYSDPDKAFACQEAKYENR